MNIICPTASNAHQRWTGNPLLPRKLLRQLRIGNALAAFGFYTEPFEDCARVFTGDRKHCMGGFYRDGGRWCLWSWTTSEARDMLTAFLLRFGGIS